MKTIKLTVVTLLLILAAFLIVASIQAQTSIVKPKPQTTVATKVALDSTTRQVIRSAPKSHLPTPEPIDAHAFVDPNYVALAGRIGWKGASTMANEMDGNARKKIAATEFDKYLLSREIQVFDAAKVDAYMNEIIGDLNRQEVDKCKGRDATCLNNGSRHSWRWFPLKGEEIDYGTQSSTFISSGTTYTYATGAMSSGTSSTLTYFVGDDWTGGLTAATRMVNLSGNKYRRDYILPIPNPVLGLMADIINDYPNAEFDVSAVDRRVDPFVRVRFDWGERVIAKWDEPGF